MASDTAAVRLRSDIRILLARRLLLRRWLRKPERKSARPRFPGSQLAIVAKVGYRARNDDGRRASERNPKPCEGM
jgi:hypothetical protein